MDDYESLSHSKWGANTMWYSFPAPNGRFERPNS